jgi:hypothetical protein
MDMVAWMHLWVNAEYNGSKVIKNTLLISQYKIFLNDSNGYDYYF